MTFLSSILAQAAETEVDGRWITHPQLPVWALAVGFVVAGLASFYLYRAQSRIASKNAVIGLTVIRFSLILLVFLMLLGLGRVFSRTGKSNGTLWLMVDQSQSMDRADAQADPVEKLRWADAAGLLPADLRPAAPDRHAARLSLLQGDLLYFARLTTLPMEEKDARLKVEEMVRGLKKWNSLLTGVADAIDKDAVSAGGDAAIARKLRSAADTTARGIEKIDTKQKPEDAATDLPWAELQATLTDAIGKLNQQADSADKALIGRNDARVTEALDKVGQMTRAQLARDVILRKPTRAGAIGFEEIFPKQKFKVLGFGEAPQVMIPDEEKAKQAVQSALAKPSAPVTDFAAAMVAINDQVGQGEPATVVALSDGRQNRRDADATDAVDRLSRRGIRVFSLGVGTEKLAPDAVVENVDAPDWIFKGDTLKLSALLRLDNLEGKNVSVELRRVRQVNGQPQETLVDTRDLKVPQSGRAVVSFAEKKDALPDPGLYDYRVVIKDVPDEVVTANNTQTVRVWVKEDKLTVLMIEDQPRWEYRYIVNYLNRDTRVKVQTMLLQPARIGYDPDPKKNIAPPDPRKPSTDEKDSREDFQIFPGADKAPTPPAVAGDPDDDAEGQKEWYPWKLIVIGDVPPEKIPVQQQKRIVKAVRDNGATLIVIGGPLAMPAAWGTSKQDAPLAELFPVDPSPEWTPAALQAHLKVGYHPKIAPDGVNHVLTQFGIDEQENEKIWNRIRTDPNLAWYWHSEYTQAKGGASVIWSIEDNNPDAARSAAAAARTPATGPADLKAPTELETAQRRALLVTMNAGLGKVLYLSGDATWRLRQVSGQNYHERLWGQVIRWAVDNTLPAGGKFVRFGSDKPRYVGGEQALVSARIVGKDLAPQTGLKVKVRARVLSATGQVDPSGRAQVEAEMTEIPGAPGRYQAVLGQLPGGADAAQQVELSLHGTEVEKLMSDDPEALLKTLNVEVVKSLNLEMRNVNADLPALRGLSRAGGGEMLPGYYADLMAEHIPELNYVTTTAEQIALFTDPKERYAAITHWAFLALFVGLISAEWIIRKRVGLV